MCTYSTFARVLFYVSASQLSLTDLIIDLRALFAIYIASIKDRPFSNLDLLIRNV